MKRVGNDQRRDRQGARPEPPFEIIEHMADVGVRARGATLAQLFENCASGMVDIAVDPASVSERQRKPLAAEGTDRESLLVNFLDEVLWLMDGEGWLPRRIAVEQVMDTRIAAVAFGEPRDPARRGHEMRLIIKAVTYHQLSVRQGHGGWVAEVYFDV